MNLLTKPVRIFVQAVTVAAYLVAIMGAILFFAGAFNLI